MGANVLLFSVYSTFKWSQILKRCIDAFLRTPLCVCLSSTVLDKPRRVSTIGVTHVHCSCLFPAIAILQWAGLHPPSSVVCSLIYFFSITFTHPLYLSLSSLSLLTLKCFRLCLSMCLSPRFLSYPSLSQTVDWYGDTRLGVFLALPQMGPWQHVRDQNVLYLSCQAVPSDQDGSCPLGVEMGRLAFSPTLQILLLIVSFGNNVCCMLKVHMEGGERNCSQLLYQLLCGSCIPTYDQEVKLQAIPQQKKKDLSQKQAPWKDKVYDNRTY